MSPRSLLPLRTWVEAAERLARAKLDHTRCSRACATDDGLLWIIQAKSVSSDDAIRRLIAGRTRSRWFAADKILERAWGKPKEPGGLFNRSVMRR